MKSHVIVPTGTVVMLLFMGCGGPHPAKSGQTPVTAEQVKEKITDAAKTTGQYAIQKKDEYQKAMEGELAKLNEQIKTLRDKLSDLSGDAKARAEKEIGKLEKQRDEFAKKLEGMKSAGAEAWQHVQQGIDSSWETLKKAYDEAASRVGK